MEDIKMKKQDKNSKQLSEEGTLVDIDIPMRDLYHIKRMAESEGILYQDYLTSIMHKLTTGQIVIK